MPKSKTAKSEGKPTSAKKVAPKKASPVAKVAPVKVKGAPVKAKEALPKAKAVLVKAAKAAPAKSKPVLAKAKASVAKSKPVSATAKPKSSAGAKATPIKLVKAQTETISKKGASKGVAKGLAMASSKKAEPKGKTKSVSKAVPAPKGKPSPAASQKATPVQKAPVTRTTGKVQKASLAEKKQLAESIQADSLAKKKILPPEKKKVTDEWVLQQRERIYELRDNLVESMHGVAKDTLRSRAEGSEASAFGMHQADAGSDSYDRDFALSLLSQEQDALYEIDEALKRIELGTYGVCEMSGKVIKRERLEALPFARYTVECQSEVERQKKLHKARMPVTSLFGLTEEEGAESEEEDQTLDAKD
jgi:RNA polymerase-binding transcription factor DksA